MSVMNMIEAMKKASGFDYKYEIIGRRTGGMSLDLSHTQCDC